MSNDTDQDAAKELVAQTAGKVYDDLAHPTVEATGQIISFVPRTIRVVLGKWEKWILNGEYAIKETEKLLADKLKNIPEDKIVEPEPYVAVPALQQLSYSLDSEELRDLYANLLASSMNADEKSKVHPAFVDIIKQLVPDEAKLLKYFSKQAVIPLVEIGKKNADGKGFVVVQKYHLKVEAGVVENVSNIPVYLDNLIRLQLIEVPADAHYVNQSLYTPIETDTVFINIPVESIAYDRKMIKITSFGKQFVKICQP